MAEHAPWRSRRRRRRRRKLCPWCSFAAIAIGGEEEDDGGSKRSVFLFLLSFFFFFFFSAFCRSFETANPTATRDLEEEDDNSYASASWPAEAIEAGAAESQRLERKSRETVESSLSIGASVFRSGCTPRLAGAACSHGSVLRGEDGGTFPLATSSGALRMAQHAALVHSQSSHARHHSRRLGSLQSTSSSSRDLLQSRTWARKLCPGEEELLCCCFFFSLHRTPCQMQQSSSSSSSSSSDN